MRRLALIALMLVAATTACAHGSHGTHQVGAAVIVIFTGHEEAAAAGWAYTVIDPDGEAWVRGMCDTLGRAVFVPDRQGEWKVRVYAPDGHGGEVVVPVTEAFLKVGTGQLGTACAITPLRDRWLKGAVVALLVVVGIVLFVRLRRS